MNGLQGIRAIILVLFFIFALGACSGGGGGDDGIDGTGLEGVAAEGAALDNAQVYVKGTNGGAILTTTTDGNGKYSIADIGGMEAPIYIKVVSNDNKTFYSFRSEITPKAGNRANIHPISDVAARNWFRANRSHEIEDIFQNEDPVDNPPSVNEIEALKTALENLFQFAFEDFEIEQGFDFIESAFNADHDGFDALLDHAKITIKDDRITIKLIDPETGFTAKIVINYSIDDDLSDDDDQNPDAPTGLLAFAAGTMQTVVIWDAPDETTGDNVGVAGYNVYWGIDGPATEGPVVVAYPVYKHENLSPGQRYCYAIEAVDGAGNVSERTAYTDDSCATTQAVDDLNPAVPTAFSVSADLMNNNIQVAWDDSASTDVIGYFVYRSLSPTGQSTQIDTLLNENNTARYSYTDNTADAGVEYCYTVVAVDASLRQSEHSNQECATITDTTPPESSASAPGGVYNTQQSVVLLCNDNGGSGCAAIYYTTDGSVPTISSTVYVTGNPVVVTATADLNFFAVDQSGNAESPFNTESYVIDGIPPTSTASVTGGVYNSAQSVELSCIDTGGSGCGPIYYTTDGSVPTISSSVYETGNPILVNATGDLNFFAADNAGNQESVNTESYVITIDVAAPTTILNPTGGFSPGSGVNVGVSCDDAGGSGCAETRCTTDGSIPDGGSPIAQPSYLVTVTTVLRCFSVDNAGNVEPAVEETYTIDATGPVTSVDQVGGDYPEPGITVIVSCDDGAGSGCGNIHCTIDGSAPSTGSLIITAPINISTTTTLRCMSVDLVGNPGGAINEQYTIVPPGEAPVNTTAPDFINSGDTIVEVPNVLAGISATDDSGIVAYMIVDLESGNTPTTPTAATAGWTAVTSTTNYSAVVGHNFSQTYAAGTSVCLYVWFLDDGDEVSNRADDCITYDDLTAPVNTTGSNFIDSGAATTNDTNVNLQISATDAWGVTGYFVLDNLTGVAPAAPAAGDAGWVAVASNTNFSANVSYQLSGIYQTGDTAYVHVWFKDATGNVSGVATDADGIGVTTQVFSETFEGGAGIWSVSNGSWQIGTPSVVGPSACNGGTQCAATVLDGNYPGNDSYLISPPIQLPTINSATEELALRFWHWFSIQANDNMRLEIRTEVSPGVWNTWETLETYTGGSGGVWTRPKVNLVDYAGQRIQLGFFQNYGGSTTAAGWYVDDISIDVVNAPIDLTGGLSYLEDFESGQGDWFVGNGSWQVGEPTAGPGAANSGTQVAGTVLAGTYPGNDSYLISPSILLPTINSTTEELALRFWHWFSIQANDNMRIEVRTEVSPGVWNAWEILEIYSGGSGGVWTQPSVNLVNYAGQKVQLGFFMNYGGSTTSTGWYVDDITIDVVNAPIDLSGGQNYLEDFESGLGDWSVGNGSWQVGTPSAGPGVCNSGAQCAATVLDGNYPGNDSYFISPAIQLPTINLVNQLLHLRFWHWFSIQANDSMRVEIRTEVSPGVWDVWQILNTYTGGSSIWSQPLIDISAYSGQKIQLGFFMNYGGSTTAAGWYMDDVTISIFNF